MSRLLDRRALLTGALALGGAALAAPALAAAETITLPAEAGRSVDVTVLRPAGETRGVVIFGHGMGGAPANYGRLTSQLTGDGWLVLAPLHVDSMKHPRQAEFSMQQSFGARLADLAATSALAGRLAPNRPVVAAGHSYGSLFALMMGGALAQVAPVRDPSVKAVLCASSPGLIPGLVQPAFFGSLAVPTMMLTGDRDTVEGFVADWRQHLAPIENAPAGDKYALVFKGTDHWLMGGEKAAGAVFDEAARAGRDFLAAYGLGDAAARGRLDGLKTTAAVEVLRR